MRKRGATRAGLVLLSSIFIWSSGGCGTRVESGLTGVMVIVSYDPALGLDQMRFFGAPAGAPGATAFEPVTLPDQPAPLSSGEDSAVILLPDALAGEMLVVRADGLVSGTVAGSGQASVLVVDGEIAVVRVALGPPIACVPGADYCEGASRRTCLADGTGPDPALDIACAFTCAVDDCVLASNVPAADLAVCDSGAPALEPPPGATVVVEAFGCPSPPCLARLSCNPDCGTPGVTAIDAIDLVPAGGGAPGVQIFCLSAMWIPAGVTLTVSGVTEAILFLVDADATVDGVVDVSGGDATDGSEGQGAGPGGPGGGDGAPVTDEGSLAGSGPGGGSGGGSVDVGAGGGGGGFGGPGGAGGDARRSSSEIAAGGLGGGVYGSAELAPLHGGSGGGSGGDKDNDETGWSGGGGGGALQITARGSITVTGTLDAGGGDGHGSSNPEKGGGGGGGSGGAILLEAPALGFGPAAVLAVCGGSGGLALTGPGAPGGCGASLAGSSGVDAMSDNRSGEGGGGGGGRVRLRSAGGVVSCGSFVSPAAACSAGGF